MSEHKENVPRLRFPGFTGAWEQRELSDLASFTKGIGYTKQDLREAGSPIILYGRLYTDYEILIEDVNTFADGKANSVISLGGEVIVPSSGESAEDISRASVVGKPGIILGGDLNVIRPNEQIDPVFLALAISNGAANREMAKRAQGKSVVHLHNSDLKKINLIFPQIEEQRNIVEFNLHLDHLITLHQCKLNNIENLKAGLLQKMFPKNGEDYPEIRFPGFTDAWEQRMLGELGSVAMNKRIFKEQTTNAGDVPFYKIGTFGSEADAYISRELFEEYKKKYPYPEVGDILISASGSIGRTVVYQGEDEYFQDSNIVWLKHDERLDNSFLKQFYSIVKWQGLEGSTIKRLYNKNILETEISVPEVAEQRLIGAFFEQFDHLITLHQRKLERLQEQKKALLQQMFI